MGEGDGMKEAEIRGHVAYSQPQEVGERKGPDCPLGLSEPADTLILAQ